jgi:hypothetical protein
VLTLTKNSSPGFKKSSKIRYRLETNQNLKATMKVQLPAGHNSTTARFSRVSKGVQYAYAGYRPAPIRVNPALAGVLVLLTAVALFALATKI